MTSYIATTTAPPTKLPLLRVPEYDPTIKRFNQFLEGRPANEETVREFFKLEANLYSARSIAKHKVAIRAGVRKAFPTNDLRVLASMDALFKSIKLPKAETRVREKDLFTKQEIRAIVAASPRHIGLFIRSMYDTGSRVSECLSMRVNDCTEDSEAVRCPITGKGKKERILTMSKKLFAQVRKHFAGNTWLFEHHGRCYNRKHMWFCVRKYGKIATGRHIHPHSFRHSRLTHLLDDGQPLAAVSNFAGHTNVKTTLDFYAHNVLDAKTIVGSGL